MSSGMKRIVSASHFFSFGGGRIFYLFFFLSKTSTYSLLAGAMLVNIVFVANKINSFESLKSEKFQNFFYKSLLLAGPVEIPWNKKTKQNNQEALFK